MGAGEIVITDIDAERLEVFLYINYFSSILIPSFNKWNTIILILALQIAKNLGATGTFLIEMPQIDTDFYHNDKEMAKRICKLFTRSSFANATIDCCGAASRFVHIIIMN